MRKALIYILLIVASVTLSAQGTIIPVKGAFLKQMQERDSVLVADQLLYGFRLEGVAEGTQLMLPDSVTELGYEALRGCAALKEVRLGADITALERGTFLDAGVETVYFGGSEEQWVALSGSGYHGLSDAVTPTLLELFY